MNVQVFLGDVVASIIHSLIAKGHLGIRIQNVTEFDPVWMLKHLLKGSCPRVAITGSSIKELSRQSKYPLALLTGDLAQAAVWRNDPKVSDPVVIVSGSEEERLGTFHRFTEIRDHDLYLGVCEKSLKEICPNEVLKRWWNLLRRPEIIRQTSVYRLASYYLYVKGRPAEVPDASRDGVYLLGLLPSRAMFEQPTASQLFRNFITNKQLVNRIEILSNPDRDRLGRAVTNASAGGKARFQAILGKLLKYSRSGSDQDRGKLTAEEVSALFEAKTPSGKTKAQRVVPIERVGVEALLEGDDDAVKELAEKLRQAIEQFEDDETPAQPFTLEDRAELASAKIPTTLVSLMRHAVSEALFGGRFQFAAVTSFDAALADLDSADFFGFGLEGSKAFPDILRRVIAAGLIEPEVMDSWKAMVEARAILAAGEIPIALSVSPLVTLAGDSRLLEAGEKYIEAYTDLSSAIRSRYEAVSTQSAMGARNLCAQLLMLDTILIQSRDNVFAILSPLHPLHLWKYVRLARQFQDERTSLTDEQRELLSKSAESLPNFLTALFVPEGLVSGERAVVLPESHQVATLPCYQLDNPHYAGAEGQERLLRIIAKFLVMYPHAIRSLRVCLVDPPDLPGLLESLAAQIVNASFAISGLHITVWRTIDRNVSLGDDDQQLEAIASVFAAEETQRFTLDIHQDRTTYQDVISYLSGDPVHVLAIFDASHSRVSRVTMQSGGFVHPLVLPKEFNYDSIEDKLVITPAATGDLFDVYYSLQNRLNSALTGSSYGISSSLTPGFPPVAEWLKYCTWLVIGDKIVDALPVDGGRMISFEPGLRRDITVVTENLTKFEREFDYYLRKANLDPKEEALKKLVATSAELVGEGLLGLIRADGGD
jgi:hypothetical protein